MNGLKRHSKCFSFIEFAKKICEFIEEKIFPHMNEITLAFRLLCEAHLMSAAIACHNSGKPMTPGVKAYADLNKVASLPQNIIVKHEVVQKGSTWHECFKPDWEGAKQTLRGLFAEPLQSLDKLFAMIESGTVDDPEVVADVLTRLNLIGER